MCSLEMKGWKAGSCQDKKLSWEHHNKQILIAGSCQGKMLSLEPHDKHILNVGYCQGKMHARLHHPGPSKITPLGARTSICIMAIVYPICLSLTQQHYNKHIHATDFNPGDINLEEEDMDYNEAICDELARHCAQHGLKVPEGYFDSDDEEVQEILSQCFDPKKRVAQRRLNVSGTLIAQLRALQQTLNCLMQWMVARY